MKPDIESQITEVFKKHDSIVDSGYAKFSLDDNCIRDASQEFDPFDNDENWKCESVKQLGAVRRTDAISILNCPENDRDGRMAQLKAKLLEYDERLKGSFREHGVMDVDQIPLQRLMYRRDILRLFLEGDGFVDTYAYKATMLVNGIMDHQFNTDFGNAKSVIKTYVKEGGSETLEGGTPLIEVNE